MDQVRNFYASNQSTVINILYIVAFVVLIYYLFAFYKSSTEHDMDILKEKLAINGNRPTGDDLTKYDVVINDGKSKMDLRANETGAYTLSFWMYITGYNTSQTGYQSILCLSDSGRTVDGDIQSLLTVALHPNQPKLFVHAGAIKDATGADIPNMERISSSGVWKGNIAAIPAEDHKNSCNVVDVDLQRWIHVTVTVNKQIVDVYMDGKLSRSCVLPKPQSPSLDGKQTLHILPAGNSFSGYLSGIHFSAYADTPDKIYARYQNGPYATQDFMDYLSDKIGFRLQFTGTSGTEYSEWNLKDTINKYFVEE